MKKIFVDMLSFLGTDKQNPIGTVLQETAKHVGEICSSAKDADIVIVGSPESAMTSLSVNNTNQIVYVAVKENWKEELVVGVNLRENFPNRVTLYGLLSVPEMAVESVEVFFSKLN